ncbi:MAG: carbohydrate kinase family protein [Candidatus Nanopelagicales bacterium]|nr:carbohydrate kinase family protein [Actinomycetota bacterium]
MTVKIIFVGDVMQDILISHKEKIAFGSDTQANIKMQGGGSATNAAVWASTLNTEVGLVARIGDDNAGKIILEELNKPNLNLNLVKTENVSSGSCAILIDATGERTMFPDPGANIFLTSQDVPKEWFKQAEIIHISAYSLLRKNTKNAIGEIIEIAKDNGLKTSVDVASSQPLIDNDGFNALKELAPWDYLFANKDEAEVLGDITKIKSLSKNLILKQGSKESLWITDNTEIKDIPEKVEVVDLIGAGDAFAAGFLVSVISKDKPQITLKKANQLGAKAVSISGARPL